MGWKLWDVLGISVLFVLWGLKKVGKAFCKMSNVSRMQWTVFNLNLIKYSTKTRYLMCNLWNIVFYKYKIIPNLCLQHLSKFGTGLCFQLCYTTLSFKNTEHLLLDIYYQFLNSPMSPCHFIICHTFSAVVKQQNVAWPVGISRHDCFHKLLDY